jgi:flagellar biosynthesis GTPase FlhF
MEQSKDSKLEELMARTNFKETQKIISHFSEKKKPQQQQQQQPQQMNAQQMAQQRAAMLHHQQQQQQQQQQQGNRPPATPPQNKFPTMPASAFKNAAQQQAYQQQQQAWMMQQQRQQQQQQQAHQQQQGRPGQPPMDAAAIASRGTLDKVRLFSCFFPPALRVFRHRLCDYCPCLLHCLTVAFFFVFCMLCCPCVFVFLLVCVSVVGFCAQRWSEQQICIDLQALLRAQWTGARTGIGQTQIQMRHLWTTQWTTTATPATTGDADGSGRSGSGSSGGQPYRCSSDDSGSRSTARRR